jgi:beta-xylosidase
VEATPLDGRDDFDGESLHPRWMSIRNPPEAIASMRDRPGWLTLHGTDATVDDDEPVFVGRRQQHLQCRVRALVDPSTSAAEAGLAVVMDESFHYEVAVRGDEVVARARIASLDSVVGTAPRPRGPVVLAIETRPHPHGPDVVVLGVEEDGELRVLAEVDGRYLSTEVTGGFTGRVIGMYAIGGDAAFDWFDYEELA